MLILAHETPNRMRFNGGAIRQNPALADSLVAAVRALPSVTDARHNLLTGSLIVHHSATPEARGMILERLAAHVAIGAAVVDNERPRAAAIARASGASAVAEAFMDAVVERVVSYSVRAIIEAIA